ncbi:PDZ domain-containing protein [Streptomyces triticagri]|uniref:PDZ domain-containing protein n=1 Tax=Streptomyces triticagri TaxID=2293568 RepID=A0A372M8J9_9ACTN|nr:S41 family peptidase [Streptomyces triticagri]RFU87169.1 PDZ domain-containing protein [Streptomyces triticagri]
MSGPDLFARPRGVRRGATLTLVFAVVLATGAATGSLGRTPQEPAHGDEVQPAPAAQRVSEAAARAMLDGKSPTDAAEDAVSRSGDRWGAVYDAGEYAEFEQDLDGRYTGVGLWTVRARDGGIVVDRVQRGGPADRAGIRSGDRLRTVDGRPLAGSRVRDVVGLLRGDRAGAGSTVELGLRRGARVWQETLHRATLQRETVAVERLPGGNVQIKVKAFTKGSGERVRQAVRRAPSGSGVLLDLRGNGGGLVDEAVKAASAFLDGGLVATYDVRGEQRALHAPPGGDADRPVVALVDGGTMSAAELLTGALQDRGRAVVVGTRTFGKGSVQMPSKLPDGSVAELTVGHYNTPSGRGVDGRGLTPDLVAGDGAQERARTVLSGLRPPS